MKTREKILQTSLRLFNESGEPHITTLDIATELDISPGNLYYHFKGKDEIIAELYARFDTEIGDLQLRRIDSDEALLDLWTYLQLSFEVMNSSLFLFRDVTDILGRYTPIQRGFNALLARQRKTLLLLCEALREEGLLQAEVGDLPHVVDHMTMTMSFWLNYQCVQAPSIDGFEPDLGQCAYQVISLLVPFLEQESRVEVRMLAEDYL